MAVSCPKCGRNNPDEAYICQFCDSPLVSYQAPPIPPVEPPQPDDSSQPSNPAEVNLPAETPESGSPEWLEILRRKKEDDARQLGEEFFNRYGPVTQGTNFLEDPTKDEDWIHQLEGGESLPFAPNHDDETKPAPEAGTPEWLASIRDKIIKETSPSESPPTNSGEDWLNKLRKQTDELNPFGRSLACLGGYPCSGRVTCSGGET